MNEQLHNLVKVFGAGLKLLQSCKAHAVRLQLHRNGAGNSTRTDVQKCFLSRYNEIRAGNIGLS